MKFKYLFLIVIHLIAINSVNSQMKLMATTENISASIKKTNVQNNITISDNIYKNMLNDDSDDLMENHPAEDLYNNIWSIDKLNPYKISERTLSDSISIDCSEFIMPVKNGKVSSKYGPRRYRYHYGVDISLPTGNDILSSFSGKVRIIGYDPGGYGNYILIRHYNGVETVYAHLKSITCKTNQIVKAGEKIGVSGNTGRSTGPHLHFETRYIGNAFDPLILINFDDDKIYAKNYIIIKSKTFDYQSNKNITSQMSKYYKVKRGDTLALIAKRNNVTLNELKRLNNFKSSAIKYGQVVKIR